MRSAIFATDRCTLFRNIASDVWNRVIYAHDVDMNLPEIGITADIIVDILQFSKYHIANFDVFAKPGWQEKIYGSDIDVFVETLPNQFRWFALQAKILKKNNKYDTLRDSSDSVMQWDKLKLLEGVSGCKAYYLLYNGKVDYRYSGFDLCGNAFNEEQFGCSLVEPRFIEALANQTSANGDFIRPTFEDIHPVNAQPWRILTCCYHDTTNFTLYTLEQILESNPNLNRINYNLQNINTDIDEDSDTKDVKDVDIIPLVENNKINQGSREAKWNPVLRIIVRRTDSLKLK